MKKSSILKFVLILILSVIPVFAVVDTTAVAKVGSKAMFTVTADGTTPFNYQWKKDAVALAGATTSTYTIPVVSAASDGAYTVTVSNSAGSTTSNQAVLASLSAPVFSTQPINVTSPIGTVVTFTVLATGNPTPTYQWQKGGVNIIGATAASYTIPSAAQSDAGTYTCIATSTLAGVTNSTTSSSATLTVTVLPPVITGITITVQ